MKKLLTSFILLILWIPGLNAASDSCTDTDGTALATHDANWVSMDATRVVGNLQINSNQCRGTGAFSTGGAMYSTSTVDTSQILVLAYSDSSLLKNVCVRAGTGAGADKSGYCIRLNTIVGANWTAVTSIKNGAFFGGASGFTAATASDHTLKITVTGAGTVTIHYFVDAVEIGSDTDASPLAAGNPGFFELGNGNQATTNFDDWTDGASASVPAAIPHRVEF